MGQDAKGLKMLPERCTGCKLCELACSWVQTGTFQPSKSLIRVHIFDEQAAFAPYVCSQCDEAWCMQVCPVHAIDVDSASGAKIVIDRDCVGCKLCVIACPFGTIFYNRQTAKAAKCDLCAGDPACVRACPTRAIEYVDGGNGEWVAQWGRKVDDAYRQAVEGGKS